MRFSFVDRVIALAPGHSIETLKNVSSTEDVFEDHFPGYPILPGALIVETFEQASQLLIAVTHDFARVGRLASVERAAFRQFVRPGDQLRVRCVCAEPGERAWAVNAAAEVDGRRVASAVLEFAIVDADRADHGHAERLRAALRVLAAAPLQP